MFATYAGATEYAGYPAVYPTGKYPTFPRPSPPRPTPSPPYPQPPCNVNVKQNETSILTGICHFQFCTLYMQTNFLQMFEMT